MKSQFVGLLAAAACGAVQQTALAGFSVSLSPGGTVSGLERWDIIAINNGNGTGTQVKGLEFNYTGSPASFEVADLTDATLVGDPDGVPDTVNLLSATRTRIRVSSTAPNNVFVGVTPTNEPVQPNPYFVGVTAFSGAVANTGITQATGTGFQIARIFLPTNSTFRFSGNIGGDVGSKEPFSVGIHFDDFTPPNISFSPSNSVTIDVSGPGPHDMPSFTATATDNFQVLTFTSGAIAAQIADNVTVTGTGVGSKTIAGTGFTAADVGTYQIAFDATDGGPNGGAHVFFTINVVVPEPTSIVALAFGGLLFRRCRVRPI